MTKLMSGCGPYILVYYLHSRFVSRNCLPWNFARMLTKLNEIFPSLSSQIPVYNFNQYMISSMQDICCVSYPAYQLHFEGKFSQGCVPNQGSTGLPQFLPTCGSFLLKGLSEHKMLLFSSEDMHLQLICVQK
jgi:hypothetical protein